MKIVYGVAAFIALVVLALFVVPYLIDWDELKPTIAQRAEERLGRKLAIDGPIDVRFLPVPKIVVRDVRLANLPGASVADMARAKQLDLELAFGPLIGGDIEVVKLDLIDPVIDLEILADGTANWHFEPSAELPSAPPADAATTAEETAPTSPGAEAPSGLAPETGVGTGGIQAVSLSNGAITYRDARTGRVEHLHSIDGTVTAREEGGPYQARGRMMLREAPIEFDGTLGRGTAATATPISLNLKLDDDVARLGFEGHVERDAGRAAGTLSLEGPNFETAAERLGMTLPERAPDLARPFALEGAVAGAEDRFDAKDLQLRVGETSASGAVSFVSGEPNQLDLVLVLNSLDLDSLTGREEQSQARAESAGANGGSGAGGIEPGAGPGGEAANGLTLPVDLVASINLTVEAIKYRGGVIRAAQSIVSLDQGVASIHQATAELPGGAGASLTGRLSTPRGRPLFEGATEIHADNLRGLASWLGIDLGEVPADRLRRLTMTADLQADEENLLVSRLDAKVDSSTVAGSLSISEGEGAAARAQITANLTIDRLALDSYMPRTGPTAGGASSGEGGGATGAGDAPAETGGGASGANGISGYDIAGTLNVRSLTYRGVTLTGVEMNPLWRDDVLTIGELKVADMAGVALSASGEGRGLDSDTPHLKARIDARAASLAPLGRALGFEGTLRLDALGRVMLGVDIAGNLDAVSLDGQFLTEVGRLTLKGDVRQPRKTPKFALDIDLANATEESLRALIGARATRQAGAPTPIWLRGRLSGEPDAIDFAAESIAYGQTELTGDVSVRFGDVRPFVTADLKSPHLAAPTAKASTGSAGGADGPASGAGGSGSGASRASKDGGAAAPSGPSRWSREPFDLALLQEVDGTFKIATDRLSLGNWQTEDFAIDASLKDGVLSIDEMNGRLFDGALAGTGRITGGTRPDYAMSFELREADIDAVLRAIGKADAATGRVSLDGALDADGDSEYAIVNSLDGEILVRGHDGTIEGIDLGAVLAPLGTLGSLRDLSDAGGLVRAGLSKGRTEIRSLDGTVRFTNGVGRTDDMKVVADAGVGAITGEADLPRWQLDLTAMFTVDQPAGTPPFGVRFLGPIDKPSRQFKLDPLLASVGERLKQRLLEDEKIQLKLRKGAKAEPGSVADTVLRGVFGDPDKTGDSSGAELKGAPPPEEAAPPQTAPEAPAPESPQKPDLRDLLKRVIPELSRQN